MMQNITALGYFAAWRILRWLPEKFVYSSADKMGSSPFVSARICNEHSQISRPLI